MKTWMTVLIAILLASSAYAVERPIKALYVTGGGWHDYPAQKEIIAQGLGARLNIEMDVDFTAGKASNIAIDLHRQPDWFKGYDVVIYNMCFAQVDDVEYVERLCAQHREQGIDAVLLHCAMHAYRADTLEWFRFTGVRSHRHEEHRPFTVKPIQPEHPVMRGFPAQWRTPQGELYEIEEVYDTAVPLAQAFGEDTQKNHVTIWTNQYGKSRIFATSIGHHNETMAHPYYLDLVARGVLYATGRLEETRPWYSLFDGYSLDGWRASEHPDSFRVEDGLLIADGPRAHLFYEGHVNDARFTDFELKMQVRTFAKANSGIFFHTRYQEEGWPGQGYEAQINATHSDRIKTGSIYGIQNLMDEAPHRDEQWFDYHIIVRDKTVTVKVDGAVVNEYTEPADREGTRRLGEGTIAIQAHDPQSVIHFRNILIRPLD